MKDFILTELVEVYVRDWKFDILFHILCGRQVLSGGYASLHYATYSLDVSESNMHALRCIA